MDAIRGMNEHSDQVMSELACFEGAACRLFAASLRYPDQERIEALVEAAGDLLQEAESLAAFAFYPAWNQALQALQSLAGAGHEIAAKEYVNLFLVPGSSLCPPYASHYLDYSGPGGGLISAMIERVYVVSGLVLSPTLGDLPDHVSVELEFVSHLCRREVEAWQRDDSPEAALAFLEQRFQFLDRHMNLWLPRFARAVLAAAMPGTKLRESNPVVHPEHVRMPELGTDLRLLQGTGTDGFYAVLAESAATFLHHERDLLKLRLKLFKAHVSSRGDIRRWGKSRAD
ncbi:MAG: molecular chaperone TorD family protein [Firmicutes bacterium]|nr:molecular chaperone TorD family protein [Bacillota bacterium]